MPPRAKRGWERDANTIRAEEPIDGPELMKVMAESMQCIVQTMRDEAQYETTRIDAWALKAMKGFCHMLPPGVNGGPNPSIAKDWLGQVEKILDTLQIVENKLKVSFATFQFTVDAAEWWRTIENTYDIEVVVR